MLLFKVLLIFCLSGASLDEERYSSDSPPPESGWKSALKFFTKDSETRVRAPPSSDSGSDASYDQYLSLDNTFFLNNDMSNPLENAGRWGLNIGYVWDHSYWVSQGLYAQFFDHSLEKRYSLLTGFILPGIESQFPIYLKANAGLGYFTGDFTQKTLTVDYSATVGLRFFSDSRFLFHLEFGSQNYQRLLDKGATNSWVLNSGLAFIF